MVLLYFAYLVFYFLMGLTQPFLALNRLYSAERKDSSYALGLKRYLLAVVAYFLILILCCYFDSFDGPSAVAYCMILPWYLAIWYIMHTRKWDEKLKNIKKYEELQKKALPHPDRVALMTNPSTPVYIRLKSRKLTLTRSI